MKNNPARKEFSPDIPFGHFRVIVAGSRSFTDYATMERVLDHVLSELVHGGTVEIVSGTARGADRLGERYAEEHDLELSQFPADWKKYGKRAGIVRNEEMAVYATHLVAFWDGESKGTRHMIAKARELGLGVIVHKF